MQTHGAAGRPLARRMLTADLPTRASSLGYVACPGHETLPMERTWELSEVREPNTCGGSDGCRGRSFRAPSRSCFRA